MCSYHTWGMLLVSTGSIPGMLLNLLKCTGQPLTTKNYPVPNTNGSESGEPVLFILSTDTQNRGSCPWLQSLEEKRVRAPEGTPLSKSIPGILKCRQTFNYSNIWPFWDEATCNHPHKPLFWQK